MIRRTLLPRIVGAARRFPVVTLTGPRQSGKTTLCRAAFPRLPHVNLEEPDTRAFALSDPRGFLSQFPRGAILDEVQRAPELPSFLQAAVDSDPRPGRFILTGSQHFGLLESVSQSLAGRTAVLHLLPLSHPEVQLFEKPPKGLNATLLTGGYPAIHDRGLRPREWLASYVATYLERDVRQVLNVGNLESFQTFIKLCAGRSGQILNLSTLGADCGISHNTARAWLSVLEAAFIVFRLPPLRRNVNKRLTKSPKLYFHDSGLLCWLLGIRTSDDILHHPLRGAVFESWVVSEAYKARVNAGEAPGLHFYNEQGRNEVDLVLDAGRRLVAVEIKSGQTLNQDFFKGLDHFRALFAAGSDVECVLIHGGEAAHTQSGTRVVPWHAIDKVGWITREGSRQRRG